MAIYITEVGDKLKISGELNSQTQRYVTDHLNLLKKNKVKTMETSAEILQLEVVF